MREISYTVPAEFDGVQAQVFLNIPARTDSAQTLRRTYPRRRNTPHC